jgi:transposase-like protein
MALDHAALLEVLDALKAGDADERVRVAAETMYQALIETELSATIGAQPWERSPSRSNQRNGSRSRTVSTTAGDLRLRIPKLRTGSFFPALLDRRRRVDQALFAVVMEAYLHGVVGARKSAHVTRPADTRAVGRRGGHVVGSCGPRFARGGGVGAREQPDARRGVADGRCSGVRTRGVRLRRVVG